MHKKCLSFPKEQLFVYQRLESILDLLQKNKSSIKILEARRVLQKIIKKANKKGTKYYLIEVKAPILNMNLNISNDLIGVFSQIERIMQLICENKLLSCDIFGSEINSLIDNLLYTPNH